VCGRHVADTVKLLPRVSFAPWAFRSRAPSEITRALQPNLLKTRGMGKHYLPVKTRARNLTGFHFRQGMIHDAVLGVLRLEWLNSPEVENVLGDGLN
jgi:hypothetical protein